MAALARGIFETESGLANQLSLQFLSVTPLEAGSVHLRYRVATKGQEVPPRSIPTRNHLQTSGLPLALWSVADLQRIEDDIDREFSTCTELIDIDARSLDLTLAERFQSSVAHNLQEIVVRPGEK